MENEAAATDKLLPAVNLALRSSTTLSVMLSIILGCSILDVHSNFIAKIINPSETTKHFPIFLLKNNVCRKQKYRNAVGLAGRDGLIHWKNVMLATSSFHYVSQYIDKLMRQRKLLFDGKIIVFFQENAIVLAVILSIKSNFATLICPICPVKNAYNIYNVLFLR